MEAIVFLFVNATKFKAKDWNKAISITFRKYIKRFTVNNIKKAELNGYIYGFSVALFINI